MAQFKAFTPNDQRNTIDSLFEKCAMDDLCQLRECQTEDKMSFINFELKLHYAELMEQRYQQLGLFASITHPDSSSSLRVR